MTQSVSPAHHHSPIIVRFAMIHVSPVFWPQFHRYKFFFVSVWLLGAVHHIAVHLGMLWYILVLVRSKHEVHFS